jgi:hypothetical protein
VVPSRFPPSIPFLVQEVPNDLSSYGFACRRRRRFFQENGLICHFNGLWLQLVDLNGWISSYWKPLIKEYLFIHPCAKGSFIAKFDLAEDKDLILDSGPWFWGKTGLCLIHLTPCFNPLIVILTSTPIWVCLPNTLALLG